MSMKKDLTGESIHLVNDETPEEDRIPEDMIEDAPECTESMVTPEEEIHGKPAAVRVKQLHLMDVGEDGATISLARHEPLTKKGFMDHGLMYDPNHPGRHPSSRDWNIPTIPCKNKTCAANYHDECVMPSLIKIGANGKCEGNHPRVIKNKKKVKRVKKK